MIRLIGVSKSYFTQNGSKQVLKDVHLFLPNKGFISLLGKSGSGKTTLLNILGGLDKIDSGTYLYNGVDTKNFSKDMWDSYRSNVISFVFQDDNLINFFSVEENLQIVLNDNNYENQNILILDTLEKFGLRDTISKKPSELSGGERQRIAIIRSLLKDSKIILVDEPTGNLDEENAKTVLDFLKKISKEKLVFMITHDKEYANNYSDGIINIKDGRIIQENVDLYNEPNKNEYFIKGNNLKLKNKQIFNFVLKNIKSNISKTIQYIILLTIALFMIGLGLACSFTNEYSIASNSLLKTNLDYIQIKSPFDEVYNQQDYEHWNHLLDNNVYKKFTKKVYINNNDILNNNIYISSFMVTNNHVDLLYGKKPNYNEILISDYLAYKLVKNNVLSVSDIKDIVGMSLINDKILISGIFNTDYESYIYMLDNETDFTYSEDFSSGEKGQFKYKVDNIYTNIFVSDNFDFSQANISVNGSFKTKSTEQPFESMNIFPLNDQLELTEYSNDITNENQIIVTKRFVYKYLIRNQNYKFNSYEDFLDVWNENEEDLSNKIIGETVSLYMDYLNQNVKHFNYTTSTYFNDYIIVGIENSNSPNLYIDNDFYNYFFKNNFSLVMHTKESKLFNEQLIKTIRGNDYYYRSDVSGEIIGFIDESGNIVSLFAFSISCIFIFFTFLLFNNLISRDIFNRKKEIGLLRTLGMKTSNISKLFIFEVIFMTCISIVLASVFEIFGILFLNKIFTAQTIDLTIIYYDFRVIIGIIIFAFIFTSISIIFPIKKIKNLSLVNTIRGEVKF